MQLWRFLKGQDSEEWLKEGEKGQKEADVAQEDVPEQTIIWEVFTWHVNTLQNLCFFFLYIIIFVILKEKSDRAGGLCLENLFFPLENAF